MFFFLSFLNGISRYFQTTVFQTIILPFHLRTYTALASWNPESFIAKLYLKNKSKSSDCLYFLLQHFDWERIEVIRKMSCFKNYFPCNPGIPQGSLGVGTGDWGERDEACLGPFPQPPPLTSARAGPFWFLNIFGLCLRFHETCRVSVPKGKNKQTKIFENHWWLILSLHKGGS